MKVSTSHAAQRAYCLHRLLPGSPVTRFSTCNAKHSRSARRLALEPLEPRQLLAASFQGLGDLLGGGDYSIPVSVSADGSTVVGMSSSSSGNEAFRWTETTGMQGLGDVTGGDFQSKAYGVSDNGNIVVGTSAGSTGYQSFYWTTAKPDELQPVGYVAGGSGFSESAGHCVSADGSIVVGTSASPGGLRAFRWVRGTGMAPSEGLESWSTARGVSGDGKVIVGSTNSGGSLGNAVRWRFEENSNDGLVKEDLIEGNGNDELALDASYDGSVIVGSKGDSGFMWTQGGTVLWFDSSPAYGVSDDGKVIALRSPNGAAIWDEAHGVRLMKDILTELRLGAELQGWDLTIAVDVSADGNVIVGEGVHDGKTEGWRAVLDGNSAPALPDATLSVPENSPNGTIVGAVTATDPASTTFTYEVIGGTGVDCFDIDPATGRIMVTYSSLLDFETTPAWTLEVTATDDDGAVSRIATVTIELLNEASITGSVFVDIDQDGAYDANEPAIDAALVQLMDTDRNILETTAVSGGYYQFEDLDPGDYLIGEVQPTGVSDGAEHLGNLGGTIVENDLIQFTLARIDAHDYCFAELGQRVTQGDAATIGFWQNKHGQALINAGGPALANWLSTQFGNVFGNVFSSMSVADFYRNELFKQKSGKSAGPSRVDAQFMAVALATYFTCGNLAGDVAAAYGFHVTDTGIGTRIVNVGAKAAAFGTSNDANVTIMQLLLATNELTDQPDLLAGAAHIYDRNGDGVIDASEAALRVMADDLYTAINEAGGI